MIPKIIHQTVADYSDLHPYFAKNIESLKYMNPDYEFRIYDDRDISEFIKSNYSANVLGYFYKLNPIYGPAKADFFRYLLMYKIGGIYLDIKSTIIRPLSELHNLSNYLLSHWNNSIGQRHFNWGRHTQYGVPNEFQQWHIVAPSNHPFLKAVICEVMRNIENYSPEAFGVGKLGVLRVTGPIAYTQAILPIREKFSHRLVDIEKFGFRYSILNDAKNALAHELLFKNHYRNTAPEPIVLK